MTVFVDDPDFTLHVGDAIDVLAVLPDESVHCVVTSPPYFGLRDYSCDGQIGLEPTLDAYVQTMVGVLREVRRVMRTDATLWLNLGDAFGAKQMLGMPWKVAFALQADGWYLRSDIIWSKPNPMPESVTDRPTKAHEYLFLLTKSARYFYDASAIADAADWERWGDQTVKKPQPGKASWIKPKSKQDLVGESRPAGRGDTYSGFNARYAAADPVERRTRNKRSVWEIATQPYPDAHFATFPQALVEPCILAGTSERGCCPECGAPWERETETTQIHGRERTRNVGGRTDGLTRPTGPGEGFYSSHETTGWTTACRCWEETTRGCKPTPVPCTVLDPFMGSGTTALVARRLGRRTIGIELSAEYAQLAATRLQQLSLLADA